MKSMLVIGVTGGVGSGKSMILEHLAERWGAETILLDELSRKLLSPGGKCVQDAVELLGTEILSGDGSIDRGAVASLIFRNERLRLGLNAIIHPVVKSMALEIIEEERRKGRSLVVIEAALLIEEHYDAICDEMWYIYADEATRYRRLQESRGYDEARIRSTMKKQLSDESFRAHADFVVDNSGDFAAAAQQVDQHMEGLLRNHL